MNVKSRAWSLLAISGRRQYGGNQGYDDDHTRLYQYDNEVGNSRQVSEGDFVCLRDTERLLGIGRVEKVVFRPATKKRFRCPECGITGIKERRTVSPRWRCHGGHEFAEALGQEVPVTHFEAYYGDSYLAAGEVIPATEIRAAMLRPSTQLSIEELDPGRLEKLLLESFPEAQKLFSEFVQSISLTADDSVSNNACNQGDYSPTLTDRRERVLRSIKERRGQSSFRKKLIKRYGPNCMVSGCNLLDIVEAAHISPYRGPVDNHPDNGLLLRADLHTLFDLDLMGIDPETYRVAMAPSAEQAGYSSFSGKKLFTKGKQLPSKKALAERWRSFSRIGIEH